MSELTTKLRDMMTTLERPDGGAASLLLQAATRIEELEASPANKLQSLGLNQDYEARGIEIMTLRRELSLERDKVIAARKAEDEANKIIEDIAKAAECENFADVIIARVAAQNQQSNAMTRICEGHIANCRKAENANARLNQNLSMAQNERDEARGQLEDVKGQLQHRSALLHDIADALGAGSRNAIPARDWYLDRVSNRHSHFRGYLDIIGEAVGKPGLSYKDLAEYFRGLNVEGLKATIAAQNERIESLRLSELKLSNVATQIANWQQKTETFIMDDPRDPDWAKQLNAIMCLMRRKENDATAVCEAGKVTLGQLAAALGVDPSEGGWHTKMLEKAEGLMRPTEQGFRIHFRNLESANAEFDKCKNRIAAANARWDIKVVDPTDYVKQLDYLIDAHDKGEAAKRELDLAVGAIKRMHAKLLENKPRTGIWPADGTFRAKLDDIEWCLYVYIGRAIADQQPHEADTKFISSVRDSLSHEILRRNKQ